MLYEIHCAILFNIVSIVLHDFTIVQRAFLGMEIILGMKEYTNLQMADGTRATDFFVKLQMKHRI